jgi:hypothetical protein
VKGDICPTHRCKLTRVFDHIAGRSFLYCPLCYPPQPPHPIRNLGEVKSA